MLALDGQLVAYLVATDPTLLGDTARQAALRLELRDDLKRHLADYMVPAHLMLLPALPLTANGKLDRKALPAPDTALLQQAYVAPRSTLEQQLAAIWSEVLNELGGHSLLATQVIARARQVLDLEVELRSLFETPDLAAFAASAGQRQWFLWQLEPDNSAYHIPAALALNGQLDPQALRRSFVALIERHESLRTTFAERDGEALQVVHPTATFELPVEVLDSTDSESLMTRIDREVLAPFDLRQGSLLRARLLRLGEERHVLVVTLHHIVSDGWSMPIMVDELIEAYVAFSQGRLPQPKPLPFQYADYAQWQRGWMEAGEQARQLAYWSAPTGHGRRCRTMPAPVPRSNWSVPWYRVSRAWRGSRV